MPSAVEAIESISGQHGQEECDGHVLAKLRVGPAVVYGGGYRALRDVNATTNPIGGADVDSGRRPEPPI